MKTSDAGIEFIFEHEGFVPYWYDDNIGASGRLKYSGQNPSGHWTIGYGTLYRPEMQDTLPLLLPDTAITKKEGLRLAGNDLATAENFVNNRLRVPINANQFDALVSHAYNTGGSENLMTLVNYGGKVNYNGVNYDLENWWKNKYITNAATGNVMAGLKKRRKQEFDLFMSSETEKNNLAKIFAIIIGGVLLWLVARKIF
jgi:lysozyme